jgi:hypothetical protein
MLVAVLTAFAVALLVAAPIVAYASRHRPRTELPTLGRDVSVPRSTCIPAALRKHPDVWMSSHSSEERL